MIITQLGDCTEWVTRGEILTRVVETALDPGLPRNSEMDKRIRIGIIERRLLARASLVRLLEAEPDFEVVGHWGSGDEALGALSTTVVDVMLYRPEPGLDRGVATSRQTQALVARAHLVVLTDHRFDELEVAALIRLGVTAVIEARTSSDELGRRIRGVQAGIEQFDAAYLRTVIAKLADRQSTPLSERQRDVLSYVHEGLSNMEIAGRLQISVGSVKAVLQQLFARVGVRRRSQLVLKAPEILNDQLGERR